MIGESTLGAKAPSAFHTLSPRERQVLSMATAGLADKQIGRELGVSVSTLRTYWDRIREKLGEGSRTAQVSAFVASEIRRLSPGTVLEPFSGLVIDLQSGNVEASDDLSREHGFEPGSVHSLREYLDLLHPDDRAPLFEVIDDISSAKTRVAHIVCRCMALNQERVVSYMFHGKLDEAGSVVRICGYRTDHRDVRSSSFGRIRVGYFERWMDQDEVVVDPVFRQIFGVTEGFPLMRSAIIERLHPDDRHYFVEGARFLNEHPNERLEAEVRICRSDGTVVPAKVVVRGYPQADGRVKLIGTVTAFCE